MTDRGAVHIRVQNYGGISKDAWEIFVGEARPDGHVQMMMGMGARFRSKTRAQNVAADLAAAFVADGRVVIIVTPSGKEHRISGA